MTLGTKGVKGDGPNTFNEPSDVAVAEDGSEQRIDFRPVLEGEIFGPLQDLRVFNSGELDPTFRTLQWPNGADFDPETLHDWPKYREELTAMARRWAKTSDPSPA
jgi:hypothetical protein